ncbi:MAG: GIY-YIG nuclease family protein [Flavobacteriales bacterium]|nr:GIY-YIG nuclease family protein [Flavobacteriales bacterium]
MDTVFVYVLRSLKDGLFYVGMTTDCENRLMEHNTGKSKFTSGHMPWEMIYKESHLGYAAARKREKYLKSAAGKRWLSKHLQSDL